MAAVAGRWLTRLTAAYDDVLGEIVPERYPGIETTPERAAKALLEMTEGYLVDIADFFRTFAADGYDTMVIADNIPFASLCEHHLLPFTGHAHVVYVPDGKVLGLSKMPRLVDAYAKRLQIQERLTQQIADAMDEYLEPGGVMVLVEAEHACATLRGVKKPGMVMRTSALRGSLRDDPAQRAEALALLARQR